jgi:hypothetical protein
VLFLHNGVEKGVSYPSSRLLHALAAFFSLGGNVGFKKAELYAALIAKAAAKFRVALCLVAAYSVVDVRGCDVRSALAKGAKKRGGVSPARKSYENGRIVWKPREVAGV